jgi:hypothetical protein
VVVLGLGLTMLDVFVKVFNLLPKSIILSILIASSSVRALEPLRVLRALVLVVLTDGAFMV